MNYGVLTLKVFIKDYIVKKDKCGPDYYGLIGQLQSGLEIIITYFYRDILKFIGESVEMLLSVLKSPYLELERGIHNQVFVNEEYYSIELIDELVKQNMTNLKSLDKRELIILNGEYIESYVIPEKLDNLIRPRAYKLMFKESSALKTQDGIFLLNPFHSKKKATVEEFLNEVIIATGHIELVAWHPQ